MRERHCNVCKKWHEVGEIPPECLPRSAPTRRHPTLCTPQITRPSPPFVSPVDGAILSDARQVRDHEKRHGIIQVGDDDRSSYVTKAAIPKDDIERDVVAVMDGKKSDAHV